MPIICFITHCDTDMDLKIDEFIPPNASFTVSPDSGTILSIYTFDASSSSDSTDNMKKLLYRWDFDSNGNWDTNWSNTYRIQHTYDTYGIYAVTLEVQNSHGLISTTTREITVHDYPVEYGTVTDIDGNVYKTIKIGEQWWMAENLRTIHYRNGDPIYKATYETNTAHLDSGAYCYYNEVTANINIYGALYNYYAVQDTRKIAPVGWHVSTSTDWNTLINNIGCSAEEQYEVDWQRYYRGGSLKETGTRHWKAPNTGATNIIHFTAVPGGYRKNEYRGWNFYSMGEECYFWTETHIFYHLAYDRDEIGLGSSYYTLNNMMSVRCVKD